MAHTDAWDNRCENYTEADELEKLKHRIKELEAEVDRYKFFFNSAKVDINNLMNTYESIKSQMISAGNELSTLKAIMDTIGDD